MATEDRNIADKMAIALANAEAGYRLTGSIDLLLSGHEKAMNLWREARSAEERDVVSNRTGFRA